MHYIDPTLEEQNFETAIIHIGINDALYDSSPRQVNILLQNIREIGKQCMSYKVKYVFISSLTFNDKIFHKLLSYSGLAKKMAIENGNVCENDLFNDELHLQNSG